MFFTASKLLAWLVQPATWVLLILVLALWFSWRGRYTAARSCVGLAILWVLAIFYFPLGAVLLRPLEQAFPFPHQLPPRIAGIVTLAGEFSPSLTRAYVKPQLNNEAERATEFIALAREHPEARLVFSGTLSEANAMKLFLAGQGIDPSRVIFDESARNTHENALYSKQVAQPRVGESWVLITSAFHMPRAYWAFRKAGWDVIPYPVSYSVEPTFSMSDRGYVPLELAIHEWVGIITYRLTGRM